MTSNTTQRNILLVEDDPDIAFATNAYLKRAGYQTFIAHDGHAAVNCAQQRELDAIVMDVRMPRKTGLEALHELKADDQTKDVPVVMLSASIVDQGKALDAGARFFVKKPYDVEQLVDAVEVAMDDVADDVEHVSS